MALSPLVESRCGGKGKAYLYIAKSGRYIYRFCRATSDVYSLYAGTGRSPVSRIHSIEIDGSDTYFACCQGRNS
jgi:hypothetical protein